MPQYINKLRNRILPLIGKADYLVRHAKAKKIEEPTEWQEDLVCVEDTFVHEIANYIVDEDDLQKMKVNELGHNLIWLNVPFAKSLVS